MSNFQPIEVVDRGSETQHQVVENSNKLKGFNQAKIIKNGDFILAS